LGVFEVLNDEKSYFIFIYIVRHGATDDFAKIRPRRRTLADDNAWVFAVVYYFAVIRGKPDNVVVFDSGLINQFFGLFYELALDLAEPI
jgi:hypothetical protein